MNKEPYELPRFIAGAVVFLYVMGFLSTGTTYCAVSWISNFDLRAIAIIVLGILNLGCSAVVARAVYHEGEK